MKFEKTVFALFVVMLFTCISTASAATLSVNTLADELITNGNCSLREALTNINNAATTYADCIPGGAYGTSDTINIPAGTYTTATTEYSIAKNVSMVGEGAGTTIINGNSLARVFNIGAYTVSISGVTITGGNTVANYGGGIFNGGTLTITNSTISGNTSNFEGGGIYTNGSALYVINSTISGNYAPKAGGIFNWLSTVSITNSTISGNTATQGDQAGGIYSHGWLTVTNSTISGNAGGTGGGILIYGTATVTNSTISGNSASVAGGGLANRIGGSPPNSLTIINSTISGNSGGGISIGVTATLSNSIVANQTSGADCSGAITSSGYNLESATSCGFTNTGDLQNTDPFLGLLQDNGGTTFTHALLNGSPAINIIPSGVNGCGTTITTDQRGVARPWPGGGLCDIGALEVECVQKPSGMVSWWGGNNNALDMAGPNNGTLVGDATFASGLVDQAFSLDGVGDYVDAGTSDVFNFNNGTGDFTINAWINPASFPEAVSGIVAKATEVPFSGWAFYVYSDGRLGFGGVGFWEVTSAPGAITAGSWAHVSVTKSGGMYTLYKNGGAIASLPHGTLETSTTSLRIGTDYAGSFRFHGLIDEVEIFNRALSADEIGSIYNAGSAGICRSCMPPPPGLVSWWSGDMQAADLIGTNNGALVGGAAYAPGKVQQAFSLDGTGYVSVPDSSAWDFGNASFTINLWVRFNSLAAGYNSFLDQMYDVRAWSLYYHAGSLGFAYSTDGNTPVEVNRAWTPSLDTWYHITIVRDGNMLKHFVDGLQLGSDYDMTGVTIYDSSKDLWMGSAHTGSGGNTPDLFIDGLIDEVLILNRALTLSEISGMVNAGAAGVCAIDRTPADFSFTPVSGVQPGGTQQTSFTVSGINYITPISITGGQYAIGGCGSDFTSDAGTVNNGDIVCVKVTPSMTAGGTVSADLTIGNVTSTFTATTLQYYARVTPGPKNYSASLTGAYAAATLPGDIIEAYDHPFNEDLDCNGAQTVTLNGGYNPAFDLQVGLSVLNTLTISGTGSLTVSGIAVQ